MKGVTQLIFYGNDHRYISTHTPVKGVTFQEVANKLGISISTHTPVKGVTM